MVIVGWKKMMELTNQMRVNWFLNQIKQKKNSFENFLFQGSYHKLLLKLIFNQLPLTQNLFVKVLIQKDIFFKLQQIDQEYNEKER